MSRAKADVQQIHALLMERFPAAFPKDYDAIRPLKIGIAQDLFTRLGATVDRKLLNCAVANQTSRDGYLLAVLHGDVRIDLNGNPAGTISAEAKVKAAQRLAASVQRQQARAAAPKAQAEKERRRAEERRRIEEKRRLKAERRRLHEEAIRRKAERRVAEAAAAVAAQQTGRPPVHVPPRHDRRPGPARPVRQGPAVPIMPTDKPPTPAPTAPPPITVKTGAGTATVTVTVKKRRTLSLKPEQ